MVTGVTSPSGGDLKQLRQQYDRLCDLMTRTAESDPEAAERVLGELQTLSDRILALESGDGGWPGQSDAAAGQSEATTDAAPTPLHQPESPLPSQRAARPSRIVSFRVAPVPASRTTAPAPVPAQPKSWRIDPPPEHPGGPADSAAGSVPPPLPEPDENRSPASAAQPEATQGADAPAPDSDRSNATMFSAAIRHWLERRRDPVTPDAADPAVDHALATAQPASPPAPPALGITPDFPQNFARMAIAIEQQAAQIERILQLCGEHQAALERLETQIKERLRALQPSGRSDLSTDELRVAVEEQRTRLTALAKTIHNLAQWLAAQHATPDR